MKTIKHLTVETKKIVLTFLFIGLVNLLFAQNTNLGTGAGTNGTNSVHIGALSGQNSQGALNVFTGYKAGLNNTTGKSNSFVGAESGYSNTTGDGNTFIGIKSGYSNTIGMYNFFFGHRAGYGNVSGSMNTYIGNTAGEFNQNGSNNLFLGTASGRYANNANNNILIGSQTGMYLSGQKNIFIGNDAGKNEQGDNKLVIDNSDTSAPLLYGEFDNDKLVVNGHLAVGANLFPAVVGGDTISDYKLYVDGGILAKEVRVRTTWADFVFESDYELMPLLKVEEFISHNKHLPGIPSESEVVKNGIEVGEMCKLQQQKIEELMLYIIELNKQVNILKKTSCNNK